MGLHDMRDLPAINGPVCNKDIMSRARFYIIPNMGPSLIVGGPRLSLEQVSTFAKTNVLPKLAKPAWIHILSLREVIYKGPDGDVWPKTLFDLNINDHVYVTTVVSTEGGPKTTAKTLYSVVFPFCMEIGPGALSHEFGTLLVERWKDRACRQYIVCDPRGFGSAGKETVSVTTDFSLVV